MKEGKIPEKAVYSLTGAEKKNLKGFCPCGQPHKSRISHQHTRDTEERKVLRLSAVVEIKIHSMSPFERFGYRKRLTIRRLDLGIGRNK